MTNRLEVLEAAAVRAQQAAGRAWADLQACPRADMLAELQTNWDMARRMEIDAYNAWSAAQGAAAEGVCV